MVTMGGIGQQNQNLLGNQQMGNGINTDSMTMPPNNGSQQGSGIPPGLLQYLMTPSTNAAFAPGGSTPSMTGYGQPGNLANTASDPLASGQGSSAGNGNGFSLGLVNPGTGTQSGLTQGSIINPATGAPQYNADSSTNYLATNTPTTSSGLLGAQAPDPVTFTMNGGMLGMSPLGNNFAPGMLGTQSPQG